MFHIYLVALVAFAVPTAAAAAPVSIVGRWKTDDGKGIVDIVPCGAKLCGRIHRLLIDQPAGGQRDERNPNKSKRGRMVPGPRIYWDLITHRAGWRAQAYSPAAGRHYYRKIVVQGQRGSVRVPPGGPRT